MQKILYILPYLNFYPPRNGGMLRNYFLCYEISKYYNITLATLQPKEEFLVEKNNYKWNQNIRIVNAEKTFNGKGFINKIKNAIKGRYYKQFFFFEPADTITLMLYPIIKKLLKNETFDIIISAHIFSLRLQHMVKKYSPDSIKILDAHNVDHLLYASENKINNFAAYLNYTKLKYVETRLFKHVDFFVACSQKDKNIFEEINNHKIKGYTVPNGADTYKGTYQKTKNLSEKTLLFCGSLDYNPNINGLLWFYEFIWPDLVKRMPDIHLTIIGRKSDSCTYENIKKDPNISFIGEVDDVSEYYIKNNISIVPLRIGSGTRLKILEAMSFGNPVISTSKGAEGITYDNNKHLMIADNAEEFSNKIIELLNNPKKTELLRQNARALIDSTYSWEVIGKNFSNILHHYL